MNTLWASLLLLVAIVVAIVIGFNIWQSRQERSRLGFGDAARADAPGRVGGAGRGSEPGLSPGGSRVEPVLFDDDPPATSAAARVPDDDVDDPPAAQAYAQNPADARAGAAAARATPSARDVALDVGGRVDVSRADPLDAVPPEAVPPDAPPAPVAPHAASTPGAPPPAADAARDVASDAASADRPPAASEPRPRTAAAGPARSEPGFEPPAAARPTPTASTDRPAAAAVPAARSEPPARAAAPAASAPPPAAADLGASLGVPPAPATRGGGLSEHTDCIVEFPIAGPVPSERLVTLIGGLRRAGSKPIGFEVNEGKGGWRPLGPDLLVSRFRAGILLANRYGPLNAMEYSDFSSAMQTLAGQLHVDAKIPEMAQVLERARELDGECAELDAQIVLNVDTPSPLTPQQFAALARDLGLAERGNNRFAAVDAGGSLLFSLALGDRSNQLTLLLDLPRAPAESQPWLAMVECARRCADRVGGRLVDDAGRALTEPAIERVERQLAQRYQMLADAGLPAGSPLALRVFN